MPITDFITANDLTAYYEATKPNSQNIGDRLFPSRKQLGLKLDFIKGANQQNVVLKASAFDTQATLRDRMPIELTSEKMPFFREGMLVKEEDRQELNLLEQTGNQALIDTVLDRIFSDVTSLVSGAKARTHAMRMQVLATGKLAINSNGVKLEFDYGVSEDNKGSVTTDWADANADPLADIDDVIEKMEGIGISPAGIILNGKTYGQIRKAGATARRINGTKNNQVTKRQLTEYLQEEYGLNVELVNDTYKDDAGEVRKFYPDGYVTFVPNQAVGRTVYGTTPEESDLQSGNNSVDVSVVDTGVAVTTMTHPNPVNVESIVSMITLPSFEGADLIYQLQTDTSADEPVDAGGEDTTTS